MDILLEIHSFVRWAIVVVSVIAIVKFALGWLRGGAFTKMDQGLASGFGGLMDTQLLLGLIFLIWSGMSANHWPLYRFEHAGLMVLAVVVSHLAAMWKKLPDPQRFRNNLFTILAALALVFMGVATLPQGWFG